MPSVPSGAAVIVASLLPAALFFTVNYISRDENVSWNSTSDSWNSTSVSWNSTSVSWNSTGLPEEFVNSSGSQAEEGTTTMGSDLIFDDPLLLEDVKNSSVVKKSVEESLRKLPTCCEISLIKLEDGSQRMSYCDSLGDTIIESTTMGVWDVPRHLSYRKVSGVKFRLEKRRPMCMSGILTASLPLNANGNNEEDAEGISGNHFLSDGNFKFENEYYSPHQFCLNGERNGGLVVFVCKVNCSDPETPCVQKCCSHDEVYSLGMNGKAGGCLPVDKKGDAASTLWSPTFYESLGKKLESSSSVRPHLIHKSPSSFKPSCPNRVTTVYPHGERVAGFLASVLKRPFPRLQFQLRKDGWLIHPNSSEASSIGIRSKSRTTSYCIDGVQNYGESETFGNLEDQTVLFACTNPDSEESVVLEKPKLVSHANVIRNQRVLAAASVPATTSTTTTTKPTTTTTTTTTSTTTTTTTTTPKPIVLPTLPTCCHLDPSGAAGTKLSHYCVNVNSSSEDVSSVEWMAASKFMYNNKANKFSLSPRPLGCKDNWTKAFILNYDNLPGGGSPSLMPNGMLKFQNEFFQPGEFCVNGIFSTIVEVLMCKTDCSSPLTPCINKCCGPNEIYSLGSGGKRRGCIPLQVGDEPWIPSLYEDMNSEPVRFQETSTLSTSSLRPHLVQKFPPKFQYSCYKNITLVFPFMKEVVPLMSPLAKSSLQFRIRKDGKILYRHPVIKDAKGKFMESIFNNVEYCVDGIRNYGEPDAELPYKAKDDHSVLFVCAMIPPEGKSSPH